MSTEMFPKIESILNYSSSELKDVIKKVVGIDNSPLYFKNQNEDFGIYTIGIHKNNSWNGNSFGQMDVQLLDQEEGKCKIIVSLMNTGQDQAVNITDLTSARNDFINAISNVLKGESVDNIRIDKGSGCLGVAVFLIVLTTALSIILN